MSNFAIVASSVVAGATNASSIAPTYPAGIESGDIALIVLHYDSTSVTTTTPSGYAAMAGPVDSTDFRAYLFAHRCDGSETGSVTINLSGATGVNNAILATIHIIRGAAGTANDDWGHLIQSANGTTTAMTGSALTTTVDGCWPINFYCVGDDLATAPSSGWAEFFDSGTTQGNDGQRTASWAWPMPAGSVSAETRTLTTANPWVSFTIAVLPTAESGSATHTENFSGSAGTINGAAPTSGTGTWTVSTNNISLYDIRRDGSGKGGGTGSDQKVAYLDVGSGDHYSRLLLAAVNTTIGPAVCITDRNNFIALRPWTTTSIYIVKRVAGAALENVILISGLPDYTGMILDVKVIQGTGKVTVKAYIGGVQIGLPAGYDITDSAFQGVTKAGIWGGSGGATGTIDDYEAGTLGASETLTCTTGPATNAVVQRLGASKAVALGGAYTGTAPTDIQRRIETEAGALVTGYDWAVISGASISGGNWSGTVTVPENTDFAGRIVKLRSRDSGGAILATTQSNPFSVGENVLGGGQSNMDGLKDGTGPGLTNKCAIFDGSSWSRTSTARATALVSELSAHLGVPVGFTETAVGATGVRQHAPAHTSTDGSIAEGVHWPTITARIAAMGGDVACVAWALGENDAGGSTSEQQYEDALNAIVAALKTETGRTGAGELSFGILVTGRNETDFGGTGTDDYWQRIRKAQADVAAATAGVFIAGDAITLTMGDNLHYDNAGYVEAAYRLGRSLAVARGVSTYDARGPRVTTATISGSIVNVNFDKNGSTALTGTGTLTGWEYYNGSTWAAATDAARSGDQVTFTGAGATQVRYLYGMDPNTANIVRGDIKAAAASNDNLPVEPTRAPITVTVSSTAAPDNAVHAHNATEPTTTAASPVAANNAAHAHETTPPAVTGGYFVSPESASHGSSASEPSMTPHVVLAIDNGVHDIVLTEPTIFVGGSIQPANASHGVEATVATVVAKSPVVVESTTLGHAATEPSIVVGGAVAPISAAHGHSATSPLIVAASPVVVASAQHDHNAASPSVIAFLLATVDNAMHGHLVSAPVIAALSPVSPASASHAHMASSPLVYDTTSGPPRPPLRSRYRLPARGRYRMAS